VITSKHSQSNWLPVGGKVIGATIRGCAMVAYSERSDQNLAWDRQYGVTACDQLQQLGMMVVMTDGYDKNTPLSELSKRPSRSMAELAAQAQLSGADDSILALAILNGFRNSAAH
jgi:hypothetical protein